MCILDDQQFQIEVYNYLEKLIHVHEEIVPRISRAAMFEAQKRNLNFNIFSIYNNGVDN